MSEKTKGTVSGGTQGATAGATTGAVIGSFFGPVGTVVGGVIGGVVGGIAGGLGGMVGGKHGDKAKKLQRMAQQIQQQREQEAYRQQYLRVLREGRIQRASSLAAAVAMGIEGGSSSQGAVSSIGSQIANQVEYMSVDRGREVLISQLLAGAQKQSKKSTDTMGMVSTASTIVGAIGTAMSLGASLSASAAASTAAEAGAGGVAQASGVGSTMATNTASGIAGNAGIVSSVGPTLPGSFSASVWDQAASQLYQRAILQQSINSAVMQTSRSYYSGTRIVRA